MRPRFRSSAAVIAVWLTLSCAACGGEPTPTKGSAAAEDAAAQTDALDPGEGDAHADSAEKDSADGDVPGAADTAAPGPDTLSPDSLMPGPLVPDAPPQVLMPPVAGELSIHQLDLPMGLVPKLGEAAIIVGPEGSVTLLDIGNNKHDDEVREAVEHLNTQLLTPARGYPRQRAAREVDWVVLTHNHGDHMGAAEGLLSGKDALTVTRGVVHRGHVDLGDGANLGRWEELCAALAKLPAQRVFGLCVSATIFFLRRGQARGGLSRDRLPRAEAGASR